MPEFAKGLTTTRAAVAYAREVHEGQRRRTDGAPFIRHPLEVASLLHGIGASDELIAAGALHDAIEKAGVTAPELRTRFGTRVAELVLAVTEDETISDYSKRKTALRRQVSRSDDEALTLFAADKLSKVRELRRRAGTPPRRRLAHYRQSLKLLQARLPECPLSAQLAAELRQLPAATAKAAAGRGH